MRKDERAIKVLAADAQQIFLLQYGIGNLLPLGLFLLPRLSVRRAALALLLILFGVLMMRWNVVIGGQAFSLSFAGYMHYELPIIPTPSSSRSSWQPMVRARHQLLVAQALLRRVGWVVPYSPASRLPG